MNILSVALPSRCCAAVQRPMVLACLASLCAQSAFAQLGFTHGTQTSVGSEEVSSTADSVELTGALTAPGKISTFPAMGPYNRIQYDVINNGSGNLNSWTLFYSPSLATDIVGAATPIGYTDSSGSYTYQGGVAYTTLLNEGFGVYAYNNGAPWTIDYEADYITFTAIDPLPAGAGAGDVSPEGGIAFDVLFSPNLAVGVVDANATIGSTTYTGTVLGPEAVPEPITLAIFAFGVGVLSLGRHK